MRPTISPRIQKARGGKLLLYRGWNDTTISPEAAISYYQAILQKMGPKQESLDAPLRGSRHESLPGRGRA